MPENLRRQIEESRKLIAETREHMAAAKASMAQSSVLMGEARQALQIAERDISLTWLMLRQRRHG
jgi:hypothetical protein